MHKMPVQRCETKRAYTDGKLTYISVNELLSQYFPQESFQELDPKVSNDACQLGTNLHAAIETYYKNKQIIALDDPAFAQFKEFIKDHPTLENIGCEKIVHDAKSRCAGTVDALFKDRSSGNTIIVDWKRSKTLLIENIYSDLKPLSPLHKFSNTNYWKNVFQVNIYAEILARAGCKIDELWIVQLHPDQNFYQKHIVPFRPYETKELLKRHENK